MENQLGNFPSEVLVNKTKDIFLESDPLYRLPQEYGDMNYYAYQVDDAAVDVLFDEGVTIDDPLLIYKKNILSREARRDRRINLVERMRFATQHLLNEGLGRPDIDPALDQDLIPTDIDQLG